MCTFNLWTCNSVLTEQSISRHRLKFTYGSVNKQNAIPWVVYSLLENKILSKNKKCQHFQKKLTITNWISIWFWNKNTKHLHLPGMGTSEHPLEVTSSLSIPWRTSEVPTIRSACCSRMGKLPSLGTWQYINIWAPVVNLGYRLELPAQSGFRL